MDNANDIKELRGEIRATREAVQKDITAMRDEVAKGQLVMASELSRLSTLMSTEAERCPYREKIAKSANNQKRLSRLEGILYGGAGLGTILGIVAKAAGWL